MLVYTSFPLCWVGCRDDLSPSLLIVVSRQLSSFLCFFCLHPFAILTHDPVSIRIQSVNAAKSNATALTLADRASAGVNPTNVIGMLSSQCTCIDVIHTVFIVKCVFFVFLISPIDVTVRNM